MKSVNPSIEIVAVEPASSAVLSGENPGPHGLQGIGAGFVPDVLNTSVYDRISKVKEQEAYKASRLLAEKEGVLVGISSGAALSVALLEAGKEENRGKTIVALLPDTGERYLSTPLFDSFVLVASTLTISVPATSTPLPNASSCATCPR